MKIHKFKLITGGLIIILLSLTLIGGANRQGYCVPEFRKLSDDELYERGMRNYMNYLVSGRNNMPVSRTDPDVVFYPDSGRAGRFRYPIWIVNEQLTTEQYNAKIYQYGKTDIAKHDRKRFEKIMAFLNAKTVTDGLSPTLQFAQFNNSFSFVFVQNSSVSFNSYNCCYVSDVKELKNYTNKYSRYSNLYEDYIHKPKFRKPFWQHYTGWSENFLIIKEGLTRSTIQMINGKKKNRMDTNEKLTTFFPLSNCGKIDNRYTIFN